MPTKYFKDHVKYSILKILLSNSISSQSSSNVPLSTFFKDSTKYFKRRMKQFTGRPLKKTSSLFFGLIVLDFLLNILRNTTNVCIRIFEIIVHVILVVHKLYSFMKQLNIIMLRQTRLNYIYLHLRVSIHILQKKEPHVGLFF